MRWIVDAQLPPALARFLKRKGHDASHVSECLQLKASDTEIWEEAIKTGSIIITKDEDFQNRAALAEECPGIVWVRFGNCSAHVAIARIEAVLSDLVARIEDGETIIEIR